jgi:hypothetical protein
MPATVTRSLRAGAASSGSCGPVLTSASLRDLHRRLLREGAIR